MTGVLPDHLAIHLHQRALALDAADPLAGWRDRFVIADPDLAYLDGNSLGMTPRRTVERVREVMETEWAGGLIGSWAHWVDMPARVGDTLATLVGAAPGEVVVHDSVSVNLAQLAHAALALRPDRRAIAIDAGDFPSDRYIVDGIARSLGLEVRHDLERLDHVAVVVRSHVDYRTAEVADMAGETRRAHAAGALTIWDLSHSAGLLEVDLRGAGAELAVGCTYKFLNGGPGSPGFSYVSADLVDHIEQPIQGWFGHHDQFSMGPDFVPHADARRLLIGTPSILALAATQVGVELTATAGIAAVADKARSLTGFALECCDAAGLASPTPTDPTRRGGHVSVRHPDAEAITRLLAGEHRVVADFRQPDLIRLGCSPLTTRFVDVYAGVAALAALAATAPVPSHDQTGS
ncbi:aminotransferase class V-fold PLP-dependent enzyme [soil metagenome]